ncbi:MAG: hypothetical protein C0501_10905 [Isosphaera sp.]|nr:hypothetical protein [Isosphaera sp.]
MRPARLLAPLAAAALLAAPAPAQPPGRKAAVVVSADGTDLFRGLLDQAGVRPVTRKELAEGERRGHGFRIRPGPTEDLIVIVLGPPGGGLEVDPVRYARDALQAGGASLVASDEEMVLAERWAAVGRGRVRCDALGMTFGGRAHCPFVVPTPAGDEHAPPPDSPLAGLFRGLDRVAVNESARLRVGAHLSEFRHALAGFPRGSWLTDRAGGDVRDLTADDLFAVGGVGPDRWKPTPYRFLALADHSVFINLLLVDPDADNVLFARRVVDYLRGPEKRSRCLFVENGRVVEQFDGLRKAFDKNSGFPVPDLVKLQEQAVALADAAVADLQTNDVPNRILNSLFEPPAIARFVLVLAAAYATWYLLRRAFAARKPADAPPPPNVPGAPAGPPGVFDRRQRELLRRDNLYEPVRDLVREFFAAIGAGGSPGAPLPRVAVAATVRRPESLRKAVKDFWAIAYGPPRELKAARWREMEPYLDRLWRAHADGKWRFESAAPV